MGDSRDNLGQAGEDTSVLIAAADKDRNARARARREERKRERSNAEGRNGTGITRVSINTPHKAQCNGDSLALTIDVSAVAAKAMAGVAAKLTPWGPIAFDSTQIKINAYSTISDLDFAAVSVPGIGVAFTCPSIGQDIWMAIAIDTGTSVITVTKETGSFPGAFDSSNNYNLWIASVVDPSDDRQGLIVDGKKVLQMFSRNVQIIWSVKDSSSVIMPADPATDF